MKKQELSPESLDWQKVSGLIPVIIQDKVTAQVLMLGYMNEEALKQTMTTGKVTFYSRSKQRLWVKGETSGNYLFVENIDKDCDNDTLLIQANPVGPTCHRGSQSCFNTADKSPLNWLIKLEDIINERLANDGDSESYVAHLKRSGINRIAQKVGEEATEVVIAALNEDEKLDDESADLLFHLLVLLNYKNRSICDILRVLQARHKTK